MEDLSAILGKTDEEIGWLVDPEQMVRDEEKIIEDGFSTYLAPGSIIRRGEVRGIISSKFPLYRDGKVIGLLGYMLDTTDLKDMGLETGPRLQRTDAITGSVSLIGVMESVLRYQDSYVFQGTDFVMIIFDINHFHIFARDYGQTWSSHLLREFSDRVRAEVGMDSVFGRMNGDHFLLVHQISDREEVDRIIERVNKAAESIEEIDDIPCTVYLMNGIAVYSDHKDLQAMLNAAEEDLKRSKGQRSRKGQK
jgi:diguanylate cyclase (GGDEF)-like protein